MKVFAINESNNCSVGYLFYYEKSKEFCIELADGIDEWDVPLLLSSFYKKGITTIDSHWSKTWVRQRIVPSDRQNINQILRDNKLKTYDEFNLLMLCDGKCEQDDYYLTPVAETDLPQEIIKRFDYKVDDVMVLKDNSIAVFFRNKVIKLFDMQDYMHQNPRFGYIVKNRYLDKVKVLVGGYGVYWDNNFEIPNLVLYAKGKNAKLNSEIVKEYSKNNVLTTSDVMKELNCSRQYVNELIKHDKLHPIKSSEKSTLFLKEEVIKLGWV